LTSDWRSSRWNEREIGVVLFPRRACLAKQSKHEHAPSSPSDQPPPRLTQHLVLPRFAACVSFASDQPRRDRQPTPTPRGNNVVLWGRRRSYPMRWVDRSVPALVLLVAVCEAAARLHDRKCTTRAREERPRRWGGRQLRAMQCWNGTGNCCFLGRCVSPPSSRKRSLRLLWCTLWSLPPSGRVRRSLVTTGRLSTIDRASGQLFSLSASWKRMRWVPLNRWLQHLCKNARQLGCSR
jgi:hypothetical protein